MCLVRQLSLEKGHRRYVFRYVAGCEADVITSMASLAAAAEHHFDWADAAVLAYQMGRHLETVQAHTPAKPEAVQRAHDDTSHWRHKVARRES